MSINPDPISSHRLMFITHPTPRYTETEEVDMVLEGGCSWIQLRMKEAISLQTATAVSLRCQTHAPKAILCINDHVDIALACGASAVHVGKKDLSPDEIRMHIQKAKRPVPFWIGATANTFEDIQLAVRKGASYIGLGPYRFTETKKQLSPVLGLNGYRKIINQCRDEGIEIPIFAIGGIELPDVKLLMNTGITGIAVSGAILRSTDPIIETQRFLNEIMIN
ncbi:thiamine phosphate synthase [Parabacteroides sp. PF5-9]|uniref:thiamine phosphate synthase n=1 Tax=Parabacteroides sp. PF5-9 TaxID=1742404 RepID=UPI002474B54C|nr:thiamine phosphate synthase [Parabacteroides sp. PF5-9]MDH6356591.1 thiamine-phosphate pyrophosphorylase [Parabacteroides sp. PF5-9]